MNWYIGQKIVAVKDHSQGKFKKGDEFKVLGFRWAICGCDLLEINIGYPSKTKYRHCGDCLKKSLSEYYLWFSEECFAPIEPKHELSEHTTETLIEELEEQLQTV